MEKVNHISGFISQDEADNFLKKLVQQIPWTYIHLFKRKVFRYSQADTSISLLDTLIEMIKQNTGKYVDSCFLNYYEDGNHYAPYHKDKYNCDLATLSFGSGRDFYFRHDKTGERHHYLLQHGDLIVFPNSINDTYKHSIPKRTKCKSPRVSILFFLQ